jgi:ribosomal protein L16 Arg81 hydroxylase
MLADRFAGVGNANVYCSFEGVLAFATHYDLHEVFAVHCEGEKVWRIYSNRSAQPAERDAPADELQRRALAERGELLLEVTMRPGDLLYIPRGYYHDALATSRESLHLTLSVMPPSGRFFLKTLKRAALREPLLRAYLPDARADGAALQAHLDSLADRLAAIVRSPAFFDSIAAMQRGLAKPAHGLNLPSRPTVQSFARTGAKARVERPDRGAVLLRENGEAVALGEMADVVEWILDRPLLSQQEIFARFPEFGMEALRQLTDRLVEAGLLKSAALRG